MVIRSSPISLSSSPNSRGRDPQKPNMRGIEADDADEDELAGTNAPEGMVRQFKPRRDARNGIGQGGMLMEKQTKLTRKAQQRKRSADPLPAPPSNTPSSVKALIER